jgi:hypothetical protein
MNSNTSIKITPGSCAPTFRGMYNLVEGSSYTQATADLEFDDNSVDAGATECHTHVHGDHGYTTRIVKIDNARAMTAPELQAAYQMAGDTKERDQDAIGKFLMGMKGGSLSQCKDITIVSHKNGSITCLHTDVDTQLAQNSFEPTEFVVNATREHLLKYIHPADIDKLLSSPSGTLIQLKNFLPEMVSNVDSTVINLKTAIGGAYPHLHSIKFYIQKDDEEPVEIPRTDLFYHMTPSALKNQCAILLQIYKPSRVGDPCRVIEYVNQKREYHGGVAHSGHYYEHFEAIKGQPFHQGMALVTEEEVERIKPNLLGVIDANMIEVTDETYAAEQATMPGVNQKGFHLVRHNRKVSAALALGHNIHADKESHAHRPRQRMEVRFPPSLDKTVGGTWNKAMRDGPLAQAVLGDALYRIFRQRGYAWGLQSILDAQNSRARPFSMESETDSDVSTDTDRVAPRPAARTFFDVIVPKTPEALPPTPTSQLETELEEEEALDVDVPLPPVPSVSHVTVPVSEPRLLDRSLVVEWETRLTGLDLGEKELVLLSAIRTYLAQA